MIKKKCVLCGKRIKLRHTKDRYKIPYYIYRFINVSCGLDLIFCCKKHKLEFIFKILKKRSIIEILEMIKD